MHKKTKVVSPCLVIHAWKWSNLLESSLPNKSQYYVSFLLCSHKVSKSICIAYNKQREKYIFLNVLIALLRDCSIFPSPGLSLTHVPVPPITYCASPLRGIYFQKKILKNMIFPGFQIFQFFF